MYKYTRGWDHFSPDNAEEFEYQNCLVCGTKFDVKKNAYGPTGWSESMARRGHKHDVLTCPHSGTDWHNQAVMLRKEAEKTSSSKLEKQLIKEADDICKTRVATKVVTLSIFS